MDNRYNLLLNMHIKLHLEHQEALKEIERLKAEVAKSAAEKPREPRSRSGGRNRSRSHKH